MACPAGLSRGDSRRTFDDNPLPVRITLRIGAAELARSLEWDRQSHQVAHAHRRHARAVRAVAPDAGVRSTLGAELDGPVAEMVVRNWGALIGLMGAMLIDGAYDASTRQLVLTVAALSKIVFIGLVLSHRSQYLGDEAGVA